MKIEADSRRSSADKEPSLSLAEGLVSVPEKIFQPEIWKQSLDLLLYICQHTRQITLLSGQKGVGKTTFKNLFISHKPHNFKICSLIAEPGWDIPILMRRIAQGFGMPWEGEGGDAHLLPRHTLWVLIIDQAEQLRDDILTAVARLTETAENDPPLHLVFVGDAENNPHLGLALEQFQEQLQVIDLLPFTPTETEEYLQSLAQAKQGHHFNFSEVQLEKIYEKTNGIAENLQLLFEKSAGQSINRLLFPWWQRLSPWYLGIAALFSLALLLLVMWNDPDSVNKLVPEMATDLATKAELHSESLGSESSAALAVNKDRVLGPKLDITENGLDDVPDRGLAVTSGMALVKEPKEISPEKSSPIPLLSLGKNSASVENSLVAVNREAGASASPRLLNPEKQTSLKRSEKPESSAVIAVTSKMPAAKKERVVPKNNQANSATGTAALLLKVPPQRFALQLFAGYDAGKIKRIHQESGLGNKAYYFKALVKGRAGYILVTGSYATRQEALAAIASMPAKARALKPWVRPYREIHQLIKKQ